MPGVLWFHQVGDDVLQRTLVADHPLHDYQSPGVVGDAVEEEVHPVEHTEAQSMSQAAPWTETDVDAAVGEPPHLTGLRRVHRLHEADEVGLRLV